MSHSKQKLAFYRKLYLCHLIHTGEHNVPSLSKITGMPRRTIQDCLKVMHDVDVHIGFEQSSGKRFNSGSYRIQDWGCIQPHWIAANFVSIAKILGLPHNVEDKTDTTSVMSNTRNHS